MAIKLTNFWLFDTGGLQEAISSTGTPTCTNGILDCGASQSAEYQAIGGSESLSSAGADYLISFDIDILQHTTNTTGAGVITIKDASDNTIIDVVNVNGSLRFRDAASSPIGTTIGSITTVYKRWDLYFQIASSNAEVHLYVDGVLSAVTTTTANTGTAAPAKVELGGSPNNSIGSYSKRCRFKNVAFYTGLTGTSDIPNPRNVRAYRSTLNSATGDHGSQAVVSSGVWVNAQSDPFADGSEVAAVDEAVNSQVATDDAGGASAGGPKNDADVSGATPYGQKSIWRAYRTNGSSRAMNFVHGHDSDGTGATPDHSENIDAASVLSTSTANFPRMYGVNGGSTIPAIDDYLLIGLDRATGSGRDFHLTDCLTGFLYEPAEAGYPYHLRRIKREDMRTLINL